MWRAVTCGRRGLRGCSRWAWAAGWSWPGCCRPVPNVAVELMWNPLLFDATRRLLAAEGLADRAEVRVGELWSTCAAQRYDLIVANLPHFAAERADDGIHLPSWGSGGADGRRWVDPFLTGLASHLAPQGLALMTHNGFIDLERTQAVVQPLGLVARVVCSASAVLSPAKLAGMTPAVRERHQGRSIHAVGAYAFVDFDIVAIEWASRGEPVDV